MLFSPTFQLIQRNTQVIFEFLQRIFTNSQSRNLQMCGHIFTNVCHATRARQTREAQDMLIRLMSYLSCIRTIVRLDFKLMFCVQSSKFGKCAASSAGPSLGTVQCNCNLYRSVAVISLPGNAYPSPSRYSSRAQQRIFSRFPLPPLKATGDEAGKCAYDLKPVFH